VVVEAKARRIGRPSVVTRTSSLTQRTRAKGHAFRSQLDLVLQLLRTGDTLVITRLDRLGRLVLHLVTCGAARARDRVPRGRAGHRHRPKLNAAQAADAQQLYDGRQHSVAQIAALLGVAQTTILRDQVASLTATLHARDTALDEGRARSRASSRTTAPSWPPATPRLRRCPPSTPASSPSCTANSAPPITSSRSSARARP
jgi:hypothetical protein